VQEEIPLKVRDIADWNRQRQAELDERASQTVPDEDPDHEDIAPAWSRIADHEREAILQPPPPQIRPADRVLDLARERGDREMSD
jgi:hypothetical protein